MDGLLQSIEQALAASSALVLPLVFLGGAATGLNPCVYPTIPVIIGYISGQKEQSKLKGLALALTFVLGLSITYVILGATASFVGSKLGLTSAGWMYIVAAVCIVVGLNMAGLLPISFATWAPAQSRWSRLSGFAGALVLGMLFGLVASPCAMPILTLIMALIAAKGQIAYGSLLMFVYAVGHGLPLVIIGTVTGALTSLERFTHYSVVIQRIGGWLLIVVGVYFVWAA
ncbi:MAG: sulfite exporter TauE/SafE family protein [Phycisphaerae bacterium]|nr:sulfite exporter TauE/SafE family protein [Phycisphaerae bacterium]